MHVGVLKLSRPLNSLLWPFYTCTILPLCHLPMRVRCLFLEFLQHDFVS